MGKAHVNSVQISKGDLLRETRKNVVSYKATSHQVKRINVLRVYTAAATVFL